MTGQRPHFDQIPTLTALTLTLYTLFRALGGDPDTANALATLYGSLTALYATAAQIRP